MFELFIISAPRFRDLSETRTPAGEFATRAEGDAALAGWLPNGRQIRAELLQDGNVVASKP